MSRTVSSCTLALILYLHPSQKNARWSLSFRRGTVGKIPKAMNSVVVTSSKTTCSLSGRISTLLSQSHAPLPSVSPSVMVSVRSMREVCCAMTE